MYFVHMRTCLCGYEEAYCLSSIMKSEEYELYFQELLCTLIGHYENVLLCRAELCLVLELMW